MLYSVDLRKKVMDYAETHTNKETAAKFDVSTSSISKWRKLLETTGSLRPLPLNRKPKKLDREKLKEYVDKYPDAYLREIAEEFKCIPIHDKKLDFNKKFSILSI